MNLPAKRQPIQKVIILLRTEQQKEIAVNKIMNMPLDEKRPIQIAFSEETKVRGLDQNRYYWLRLGEISAQAWSAGRQYSSDVWHEYCKRNVMPDQVETKNGEVVSKWIESPDGQAIVISTTELSKKQFAEYTEMCEAFGANLGVMFSANPHLG